MSSIILNASPQSINLGTLDTSGTIVTPSETPIPQHLPKVYFFAKKGTSKPTLVQPVEMSLLYGSESFDIRYKWFNHQTRYIQTFAGNGNIMMAQRLIPTDAGPVANATIYCDMIADNIPNYLRNSDGSYVVDPATNQYKVNTVTPTIPGYRLKFIKDYSNTTDIVLGMATSKTGTMVDSENNPSTMHPIIQYKASEQAAAYNENGLMFINPDVNMNKAISSNINALVYNLALVNKPIGNNSYNLVQSLYGETSVQFSLMPNAINPITQAKFDLDTVFSNNWYNETDTELPLVYNEYEGMYVYNDNVKTILTTLMTTEAEYISTESVVWTDGLTANTISWFDFSSSDATELVNNEIYLLNLFNCKSSTNVNYFSAIVDNTSANTTGNLKEVTMSSTTPVYLSGGSDGTLDNTMYESLLVTEMAKYADSNSQVIDDAVNVESTVYDSGVTFDTKKAMINFISVRKDTSAIFTTHDDSLGKGTLSLSDQRAIASALKTMLKLAPESTYYGTGVARAVIVSGTGNMPDNSTADSIPLNYSIANKASAYMGAASGNWNISKSFGMGNENIITELKNIQPSFIPAGIKPTLWSAGIVWAQPYDIKQYHFPAIQTVYDDDTSVLNSFPVIVAIGTVTKAANKAWRNFTGVTTMTDAQLSTAIVNFINAELKDKFGGVLTVVPEVQFTAKDLQLGYSWRLVNKIYANNMKTVMVYTTETFRA